MSSSAVAALAPELDVIEAHIHTAWEPTVNVHWVFLRDCLTDYDVALDVQGNQSISYGRDLHDQPPVGIDFAIREETATMRQTRLRDEALLASGRILGLEWFVFDPSESCQSPFRRGCSDHSPLLPSTVLAATALYGGAEEVFITPLGQCMQIVEPYQSWKPPYLTVRDCGNPTPVQWSTDSLWPSGLDRGVIDVITTKLDSTSLLVQPLQATGWPAYDTQLVLWEARTQGTLTSVGGLCLSFDDVPTYRTCDNTANQTLNVTRSPTLSGGATIRTTTKCLHTTTYPPYTLETTTYTGDEDASDSPCVHWQWILAGMLRYPHPLHPVFDYCLTIPDGGGYEGAPVTLEPCREGATNQRWTFSGEVRTGADNPSPGVLGAPTSESDVPVVLSKEFDHYDANGVRLEVRERWWSYVP